MTKHDWFWVFVKVAGLIMLCYCVFTLVMTVTLGSVPRGDIALRLLVNVGAVGAIGVWLIRDGNLLMRWARASDRDGVARH